MQKGSCKHIKLARKMNLKNKSKETSTEAKYSQQLQIEIVLHKNWDDSLLVQY